MQRIEEQAKRHPKKNSQRNPDLGTSVGLAGSLLTRSQSYFGRQVQTWDIRGQGGPQDQGNLKKQNDHIQWVSPDSFSFNKVI